MGETLTADISGVSDPDGIFGGQTYIWFGGATELGRGVSYTLTEDDLGSYINVLFYYIDNGGAAEEANSLAVGPVTASLQVGPTISITARL